MGSYPVERAQSLVETRLMSPSFSEAVARAAVSAGFPFHRTYTPYNAILPVLITIITATALKNVFLVNQMQKKSLSLTLSLRICGVGGHFLICVFLSKQLTKVARES